jgi:hypothetical protein
MSNHQQSNQIPGVPEGWEAVSFDYVSDGECWLDKDGDPIQHTSSVRTQCKRLIIRKIERPAKYRPFANAEEYMPHWGKPIRMKSGAGFDSVVGTSVVGVYIATAAKISYCSLADAFERLTFADGTPFGVKIDSVLEGV